MRFSIIKTSATIATVAMLTLGGCSSQPNLTLAQQKAGDYEELNFDIDKCLPLDSNLYRCPAVDKPICTTEFSNPDIECVHIGKRGNVYVQRLDGFGTI
jgi:hypothetical protein